MDALTVQRAIDELTRQGKPASVRKVRALTRGSLRDVSRLLRAIKAHTAMPTPGGNTASVAPMARRYVCARFPELRIGRHIRFSNGAYETADETEQAAIEANDWFLVFIHPA